jgi:hypothetical protein
MPQNGEINTKFGVYKSNCCGAEIVIPDGVTFPDCAKHFRLPTEWKPIDSDRVSQVAEIFLTRIKKTEPAA